MGACDRHDTIFSAGDQLSQRVGATHDREAQGTGLLQLRVIPGDGGRNYNGPSPFHMTRIVTPPNGNSQGGQVIGACPRSV
jgi:hypothetical protein